jgi:hypothetical protein
MGAPAAGAVTAARKLVDDRERRLALTVDIGRRE